MAACFKLGIKAKTVQYDEETDEYEIDLSCVSLIALDSRTKVIRIKIKSDQITSKQEQSAISIVCNECGDNKIDECESNKEDNKLQNEDIDDNIEETKEKETSENEEEAKEFCTEIVKAPSNSFGSILSLIGSLKPPQNENIIDDNKEDGTPMLEAEEEDDANESDSDDDVDEEPESESADHQENEKEHKTESPNMDAFEIGDDDQIEIGEDNNEQKTPNIEDETKTKSISTSEEEPSDVTPIANTNADKHDETKEQVPETLDDIKSTIKSDNNEVDKKIISLEQKMDDNEVIDDETKENEAPNESFESAQDSQQNSNDSDLRTLYDEVDDIDIAMNEIIEQSANKNSDDTNDDDEEDNSKFNKMTSPKSTKSVSNSNSDTANSSANDQMDSTKDWRIVFRPHRIKKEWLSLMPKTNDPTNEHFSCHATHFDDCPCIQRLLFIANNYILFLKYKKSMKKHKSLQSVYMFATNDYPKSMTHFLNLLINYNKVRLMNDYYHIKRYHLKQKYFLQYYKTNLISTQCVTKNRVCLQWQRNNDNKELYRCYSVEARRNLYFVTADANIRNMSNNEMHEINLQIFCDMIHSSFCHKAISNGKKFTSKVYTNQLGKRTTATNKSKMINGDDTSASDSSTDTSATLDDEKEDEEEEIVDAPNYIFGGFGYNYWDKQRANYLYPKYGNFKKELLQNRYSKMDKNDYNLLWFKAKDYTQSNEGRYCVSKRIKERSRINKIGKEITMDQVMALLVYCNYNAMTSKLKKGCQTPSNSKTNQLKHSEVVNWCKLLSEIVYCFGAKLNASQYLYHHIQCKLTFNTLQCQFNAPTSTTSKYIIAKSVKHGKKGICLKLEGTEKALNCYFDVSNVSNYPNERECMIFGDKFEINDLIIHGMSHCEELNILRLYYQIIRGRWYTQNKQQFKKKNQREIIKLIDNMMMGKERENYIQRCFETMTKNLRKNIIWINKAGLTQLLPELKQLFFDQFLDHLRVNYNIKNEAGHIVQLKVSKEDIQKSTREKASYSEAHSFKPLQLVNSRNIPDLSVSFRCYSKYDVNKQESVLKAEFVMKPFSKRIAFIQMSGGIWFPQLALDKWDFCTFSHNKLTKGSSLFSLKRLKTINDPLIINVCFQIKDITSSK